MRVGLVSCLLILFATVARAQDAAPLETELSARLSALMRSEPLDDSVRRPLQLAQAALGRARSSAANGDRAGQARTEQLARAALELAEARLKLLRERTLLKAAQARRATSYAERETARRALERERGRVSQLERASQP